MTSSDEDPHRSVRFNFRAKIGLPRIHKLMIPSKSTPKSGQLHRSDLGATLRSSGSKSFNKKKKMMVSRESFKMILKFWPTYKSNE